MVLTLALPLASSIRWCRCTYTERFCSFSFPHRTFFSTLISSITLLPLILCLSRLYRADSLQKLRKLQIQIRKFLSSTLQVPFLLILTPCLFASMSSYIPFVRSPCTWPQVFMYFCWHFLKKQSGFFFRRSFVNLLSKNIAWVLNTDANASAFCRSHC